MKPADFYLICKKDVWSHNLSGNEAKDSAIESKLPKSKTSSEMSRELNLSKTVFPVEKPSIHMDSGAAHHKGDASLWRDTVSLGAKPITGSWVLWNSSKLHCFQFHLNIYQVIIISNRPFQSSPMKRDEVVKTVLAPPSPTVHCSTMPAGTL